MKFRKLVHFFSFLAKKFTDEQFLSLTLEKVQEITDDFNEVFLFWRQYSEFKCQRQILALTEDSPLLVIDNRMDVEISQNENISVSEDGDIIINVSQNEILEKIGEESLEIINDNESDEFERSTYRFTPIEPACPCNRQDLAIPRK